MGVSVAEMRSLLLVEKKLVWWGQALRIEGAKRQTGKEPAIRERESKP
jgi:hypothetical protein